MYSEFESGHTVPGTPYRVIGLLGQGGMGSVYEVEHTELGKRFVLKALLPEFATRSDLVQRLRNEWRALGRLEHPNIVSVTDAGVSDDGVPYYVMQCLRGETLASRLRHRERLGVSEACDVAAQILDGLSVAHDLGIVHRDVKPPNIFITHAGVTKVLDFGIAKLLDANKSITGRGYAIGTPRYMSPEQATGGTIDARADLYAVGLLLFEMLTGRSPFEDCPPPRLFFAHVSQTPDRISTYVDGVPAELEHFVASLLEKKPEQRPRSAARAAEVLRAIGRSVDGRLGGDTLAQPLSSALTPLGTLLPPAGVSSARVEIDTTVSEDGPTLSRSSVPPPNPGGMRPQTMRVAGSNTEVLPASERALAPTRTSAPAPPLHGTTPLPVSNSAPPPWGYQAQLPMGRAPSNSGRVLVASALGTAMAFGAIWLLARDGAPVATAAGIEAGSDQHASSSDQRAQQAESLQQAEPFQQVEPSGNSQPAPVAAADAARAAGSAGEGAHPGLVSAPSEKRLAPHSPPPSSEPARGSSGGTPVGSRSSNAVSDPRPSGANRGSEPTRRSESESAVDVAPEAPKTASKRARAPSDPWEDPAPGVVESTPVRQLPGSGIFPRH